MCGRAPLKRYGGEYTEIRMSKLPLPGLSPTAMTRPSGNRNADEWYVRGTGSVAMPGAKEFVAGAYIEASYPGSARLGRPPPVSKTLPSGSSTADTYILPV